MRLAITSASISARPPCGRRKWSRVDDYKAVRLELALRAINSRSIRLLRNYVPVKMKTAPPTPIANRDGTRVKNVPSLGIELERIYRRNSETRRAHTRRLIHTSSREVNRGGDGIK